MATTVTETTDHAKATKMKDTTDRGKAKKRKETPDRGKAKKMKESTDRAKAKKRMKETTDRAKAWKCVRFDDNNGFHTKFNKTNFPDELRRELYYYIVKCVEQLARGLSPTSVAKKAKFQKFQRVSEGLKRKALREGYQSFSDEKKKETVEKLVDELYDELAAATSHGPVQGVDTHPDDMQVGEGSGPDPASEGVANTSLPPDDSSLQNVPLGSVRSVRVPGVPPGFTVDLGSCTLSQLDNPEGRPPPSSRQCPDELNQSMSDTECRASRYPDMLPEFERLKQQFILYANKVKDREMNERLSLESRSNLLRRSLEEIPSRLPEGILAEDRQNQFSKASMEDAGFQDGFQDVGFQGSYYPASDFGVKNNETPMPHGEEDGLLRNRSISEALEVLPRLTGRYRKNVGDIRPEVYGGSADGDPPSKPIMHVSMEGFSPQASDLQVSDLCSGGKNFAIMPNPGGNNTLQTVPIDRFVSAEPSADEREQCAEWQLRQFDMPVEEDVDMQVNNPGQIRVDEMPAAAPNPDLGNTLSNDASLQNVARNQWDNSQGRYPVPVKDLLSFLSDISRRASRFPGSLPKFEFKEEAFRSFLNGLEFLEGALEDRSTTSSKSRQEELYATLEDLPDEDLQNVTSIPSMESWADAEFLSNLLASPETCGPCTSPNLYRVGI